MITTTRAQRSYDHRLKQVVRQTGKIDVALKSGVPRSTAYGWLANSRSDVVTLDVFDVDVADLQREVIQLRRRCVRLIALLRRIITVMKVSDFSMSRVRLPEEQAKRRVLRTITQARVHFTFRTVLRVIGLTHGRFHAWTRDACGLDDADSCPKTSDEMYFGTGKHIPKKLKAARLAARRSRLEINRSLRCEKCEPLVAVGS